MNNYILGYHKDDVHHTQGLIDFKSVKRAYINADEFFSVVASSISIAKKEYETQRQHYLSKVML